MNLLKFLFPKPVKHEVGDIVKYRGLNEDFKGKIEKIIGEQAKVRCFVMGSEVIQWIPLSRLRKLTKMEELKLI